MDSQTIKTPLPVSGLANANPTWTRPRWPDHVARVRLGLDYPGESLIRVCDAERGRLLYLAGRARGRDRRTYRRTADLIERTIEWLADMPIRSRVLDRAQMHLRRHATLFPARGACDCDRSDAEFAVYRAAWAIYRHARDYYHV